MVRTVEPRRDPSGSVPTDTRALTDRFRALGQSDADPLAVDAAMIRVHGGLFGALPRPALEIRRYRILEQIGVGGMGSVYRAVDPTLSREVAVKVLGSVGRASTERAAVREIHREARALAGIVHPNVLRCFDVGLLPAVDGTTRPYVVTELVDGRDLAQVLRSGPMTPSRAIEVFVAAGRGLAAVHAAGLVHRDFKPANVLLGADGRVLVSDFGLARPYEVAATTWSGDTMPADDERTTSWLQGTPPYMAPEQLRGTPCGPAADQFAFCASLFEAVAGVRPFRADTVQDMLRDKASGPPKWFGRDAPQWLRSAILRGLEPDPSRRHASMEALVHALVRGGKRRSFRAAGLALVGIASIVALSTASADPGRSCAFEDVRTAYDADAQATIASVAPPSVVAELDRHAAELAAAQQQACAAATVAPNLASCLDGHLAALRTVVAVVGEQAGEPPARADATLFASRPADCFAATDPQAPDVDVDVDAATREHALVQARALRSIARNDEARSVALGVRRDAHSAHDERRFVEATELVVWIDEVAGRCDDALQLTEPAFFTAQKSGLDAHAYRLAAGAVRCASLSGRLDDAELWSRHATSVAARLGTAEAIAESARAAAQLALASGRAQDARERLEQALAETEAKGGLRDDVWVRAMATLAHATLATGDAAGAVTLYEDVLETAEQALDPGSLVILQIGHAVAVQNTGDVERAAALDRDALARAELVFGPDHRMTLGVQQNLAELHRFAGESAPAERYYRAALEGVQRTLGPEHPDATLALLGIGLLALDTGDAAGAKQATDEALAVLDRMNAGPVRLAPVLVAAATATTATGDLRGGRALARRAQDVLAKMDHVPDGLESELAGVLARTNPR